VLLFPLECGQLGKEILWGLRLIELLAMLIVVQEKIVHSLMFFMDMLFLSCMSFFVYAFDL